MGRKEFHSGEPFCHWWRKFISEFCTRETQHTVTKHIHIVAPMLHLRQTIQFENDECGVDGSAVRTWCCIFFYLSFIFPANLFFLSFIFPAKLHALSLFPFPCNHFVQSQSFFCMCGCSQRSVMLAVCKCLMYVHKYYIYLCSYDFIVHS